MDYDLFLLVITVFISSLRIMVQSIFENAYMVMAKNGLCFFGSQILILMAFGL